ncbi:hypothetical protein Ga0100231_019805 [Opitutaceae bacterium TAV4]|nr:hypothetical protein Ga0100231_019805 [Opitutaceae bacterium TAV4]RRK00312.1 hypothetical protein Ga0100230_020565 [Opitutaceae bacterium TAV3]
MKRSPRVLLSALLDIAVSGLCSKAGTAAPAVSTTPEGRFETSFAMTASPPVTPAPRFRGAIDGVTVFDASSGCTRWP